MTDFNKNEVFVDHPYNDAEKLLEKKTGEKDGYNALEKLADGDGDLGYSLVTEKVVLANGETFELVDPEYSGFGWINTNMDFGAVTKLPDFITFEFECDGVKYVVDSIPYSSENFAYVSSDFNIVIYLRYSEVNIKCLDTEKWAQLDGKNLTNVHIYGTVEEMKFNDTFIKAVYKGEGFTVEYDADDRQLSATYDELLDAKNSGLPLIAIVSNFFSGLDLKVPLYFSRIRIPSDNLTSEPSYMELFIGSHIMINDLVVSRANPYIPSQDLIGFSLLIYKDPNNGKTVANMITSNNHIDGAIHIASFDSSLPIQQSEGDDDYSNILSQDPWWLFAYARIAYTNVILKIKNSDLNDAYDAYYYAGIEADLYENMGGQAVSRNPKGVHYVWFANGIKKIKVTLTYKWIQSRRMNRVESVLIDYDES